ncbi:MULTISPECIES: 2-dehydro-3-deoxy-6-phosphogalactonate aldolase [Aliiglaciecola]|uniref:2-dehydro-3-deoxy-6-phosphogalactonate aldolase n=1 Tax=Aliiglaciecola TaxID=1406885 RepID=UPI001C099B1C|nr:MULTISPECIES: 2-dehydro-3-deoxy-6-phosphogalactonate aldolase [Aliiglaciecola]MBU2878969.1 2-dehydro-3-deoxy-6-phosphogalactonate aldolase [Aliiglaciecola lipolytica]MDO6710670.1 2-dehydro-3-deoxy-6-phosphogalactonate aldolase [Aliiglaciecola sp. 2_MG-2023]MDO6751922.1 2-dehydro-3-deoxy-6-phosphogalactonate aldolase [Aliiglaciecola sp. 1_MG-2023]
MTKQVDLTEQLPLIAIIRGVTPDNVIDVAGILIEEGFTMIEVPLNSPDPLTSIRALVKEFGSEYLIGAGTVTTPELAAKVIDTGANLVVTPNCDPKVISMCVNAGCATFPGVATPTEAFTAISAGATDLKLFPVSMFGIEGMKALKSVLPNDIKLYPVGGINPSIESMQPYIKAGAAGFGLGSALFKSSMSLDEIRKSARSFVHNFRECVNNH